MTKQQMNYLNLCKNCPYGNDCNKEGNHNCIYDNICNPTDGEIILAHDILTEFLRGN